MAPSCLQRLLNERSVADERLNLASKTKGVEARSGIRKIVDLTQPDLCWRSVRCRKFLQDMEYEGESRLATVASEVAYEPFDAGRFRLRLKDRLQRFRYPQPVEREQGKETFYERLREGKGVWHSSLRIHTEGN